MIMRQFNSIIRIKTSSYWHLVKSPHWFFKARMPIRCQSLQQMKSLIFPSLSALMFSKLSLRAYLMEINPKNLNYYLVSAPKSKLMNWVNWFPTWRSRLRMVSFKRLFINPMTNLKKRLQSITWVDLISCFSLMTVTWSLCQGKMAHSLSMNTHAAFQISIQHRHQLRLDWTSHFKI